MAKIIHIVERNWKRRLNFFRTPSIIAKKTIEESSAGMTDVVNSLNPESSTDSNKIIHQLTNIDADKMAEKAQLFIKSFLTVKSNIDRLKNQLNVKKKIVRSKNQIAKLQSDLIAEKKNTRKYYVLVSEE